MYLSFNDIQRNTHFLNIFHPSKQCILTLSYWIEEQKIVPSGRNKYRAQSYTRIPRCYCSQQTTRHNKLCVIILVFNSSRFLDILRRYNYVTPTSYLELIMTFKTLLSVKRENVRMMKNRYVTGLEKLAFAASQVAVMQQELQSLQPELIQTSQETDSMMIKIEEETKDVDAVKEVTFDGQIAIQHYRKCWKLRENSFLNPSNKWMQNHWCIYFPMLLNLLTLTLPEKNSLFLMLVSVIKTMTPLNQMSYCLICF